MRRESSLAEEEPTMWAKKTRGWRKKDKRAVSPIIATILLVAITVVLAAVLYVLISGLTKGPGNTPLGTAFAWGPPSTITGTTTTAGCVAPHICYSLEIASATSGLTGAALTFSARTASGGAATLGTYAIKLVGVNGTATTAMWTGSGACTGAACTNALASGQTLVIDTGAGTDVLAGDTILAVGGGSFSGTVASASLT